MGELHQEKDYLQHQHHLLGEAASVEWNLQWLGPKLTRISSAMYILIKYKTLWCSRFTLFPEKQYLSLNKHVPWKACPQQALQQVTCTGVQGSEKKKKKLKTKTQVTQHRRRNVFHVSIKWYDTEILESASGKLGQ